METNGRLKQMGEVRGKGRGEERWKIKRDEGEGWELSENGDQKR